VAGGLFRFLFGVRAVISFSMRSNILLNIVGVGLGRRGISRRLFMSSLLNVLVSMAAVR
jgi:hypothetical protein